MKTLLAGALVFGLGTIVLLQGTHGERKSEGYTNVASKAAFRDRLFLGHRDAAQQRDRHAAIGRWSAGSDREAFRSGYDEAYDQVLVLSQQNVASLDTAHDR